MKGVFLISIFIILGSCSIPKEYFIDHQEFESQLFLKGDQFELYHHDWHIEEEFIQTGTWEYSDSILSLKYYHYYYGPPIFDSISQTYYSKKIDSIEFQDMYWLQDNKLYYLLSESASRMIYNSLGIDKSPFTTKSKLIGDSIYLYSPLPSYEAGKIKGIKKKIKYFKTE